MYSKYLAKYLQCLPYAPGVYLMRDSKQCILYVGKAKSLKKRVSSYFQASISQSSKIKQMVRQVASIDFIETQSEVEALILESKKIRELQPKYNSRQKDDKSYPYLTITKEEYPRVMIARKNEGASLHVEYYGPYLDAHGLKKSFQLLQKIFKFRTCDLNIPKVLKRKFRPCLLGHIGYCSAPCSHKIIKKGYCDDIDLFKKFLGGDHQRFLRSMRKQMTWASEKLEFEKAAWIRDQIRAIESLDKRPLIENFAEGEVVRLSPESSLAALKELLGLPKLPEIIEGVDISHHSGKEAVGALVTFVNGIPYSQGYRRYKIASANTEDDYSMLCEVLRRRFCGTERNRALPNLLLIDGGKGQLQAVVKELGKINVKLPAVISLAKKQEEIYRPGERKPLDLPKNSLAHRIVCHVRDEAHRFAQSYHHHLKCKKIRGQALK